MACQNQLYIKTVLNVFVKSILRSMSVCGTFSNTISPYGICAAEKPRGKSFIIADKSLLFSDSDRRTEESVL